MRSHTSCIEFSFETRELFSSVEFSSESNLSKEAKEALEATVKELNERIHVTQEGKWE
jgi:high-affinity K+ transport system ATPase subunit B